MRYIILLFFISSIAACAIPGATIPNPNRRVIVHHDDQTKKLIVGRRGVDHTFPIFFTGPKDSLLHIMNCGSCERIVAPESIIVTGATGKEYVGKNFLYARLRDKTWALVGIFPQTVSRIDRVSENTVEIHYRDSSTQRYQAADKNQLWKMI